MHFSIRTTPESLPAPFGSVAKAEVVFFSESSVV